MANAELTHQNKLTVAEDKNIPIPLNSIVGLVVEDWINFNSGFQKWIPNWFDFNPTNQQWMRNGMDYYNSTVIRAGIYLLSVIL